MSDSNNLNSRKCSITLLLAADKRDLPCVIKKELNRNEFKKDAKASREIQTHLHLQNQTLTLITLFLVSNDHDIRGIAI